MVGGTICRGSGAICVGTISRRYEVIVGKGFGVDRKGYSVESKGIV